MAYAAFDSSFADLPIIMSLSIPARMAYVGSVIEGAKNSTDPGAPIVAARDVWKCLRLAGEPTRDYRESAVASELIDRGLWKPIELGMIVHLTGREVAVRGEYAITKSRIVPSTRAIWDQIARFIAPTVYGRDGHACVHCGASTNLTVDHIVALSKGGTNDLSNLQTLCRSCNSRKGVR